MPEPGAGDPGLVLEVDRVVHEPARLLILSLLATVVKADFVYVIRSTGLTRGNLSSHVNKLEAAGYVEVEKIFVERVPRTLYRLTDAGRTAFTAYRKQMLRLLAAEDG